MSESPDTGIEESGWVEKINRRELAALTSTVRKVQNVVGSDKSSLHDLSHALQNDPALVAKVLRIANSPSYMVTSDPVTTITRASSLIGFDAIRNICITNRLLEALVGDSALPESVTERLLTRVAASLHAGIQARMLMKGATSSAREEAFLAALLDQIGESAFWSAGGAEVEALDAALAAAGRDTEPLVREHLGGSFRELSVELIRSWGLESALGGQTLPGHVGPSQSLVVRLANDVADVAAQEGWQSPRMKPLYERAAALMDAEVDEAAMRLRACAKQAEELAACYGSNLLARRMSRRPPPPEAKKKAAPVTDDGVARPHGTSGDSSVQLRVLREMSEMSGLKTDLNTVIRTAMGGIHEGIGMERTITALLTPERSALQMRLVLGDGGEQWGSTFRFPVPPGKNLLQECVGELQSFRYNARTPGLLARRLPVTLQRFSAGQDFLLAPIVVGPRSIGVLYADRAPTGTPVNEDEFKAFAHFAQQLGMCLTAITQRRA